MASVFIRRFPDLLDISILFETVANCCRASELYSFLQKPVTLEDIQGKVNCTYLLALRRVQLRTRSYETPRRFVKVFTPVLAQHVIKFHNKLLLPNGIPGTSRLDSTFHLISHKLRGNINPVNYVRIHNCRSPFFD